MEPIVAQTAAIGRVFQLEEAMPSFRKVVIVDEYGVEDLAALCKGPSKALVEASRADYHISDAVPPCYFTEKSVPVRMFYDLTHYRFQFIDQLRAFSAQAPYGSIFCGNRAEDGYVQEQLQEFSSRYAIPVEIRGGLWFVRLFRSEY